jgi:hypothetical protein
MRLELTQELTIQEDNEKNTYIFTFRFICLLQINKAEYLF